MKHLAALLVLTGTAVFAPAQAQGGPIYAVTGNPEAAAGFWAYVRDQADHRYAPEAGPWQSVVATKTRNEANQPAGYYFGK